MYRKSKFARIAYIRCQCKQFKSTIGIWIYMIILLLFLKSCHFFKCHLVLRRRPFYMALFLHFKITVALFAPMTWTDFIRRPLTVRHEWSKKPDRGRYEDALLRPPCFLDRGRACCVHNCRSRFQRTHPLLKKKKTWGGGRGKKWSQLYNTSALRCCSLLSSSPHHHYYYYSW